jgi:hypothetical protein
MRRKKTDHLDFQEDIPMSVSRGYWISRKRLSKLCHHPNQWLIKIRKNVRR